MQQATQDQDYIAALELVHELSWQDAVQFLRLELKCNLIDARDYMLRAVQQDSNSKLAQSWRSYSNLDEYRR